MSLSMLHVSSFFKNYSMVDLQYFVSIGKGFSYIHIYVFFFQIIFHYRLLQDIEYSFLC